MAEYYNVLIDCWDWLEALARESRWPKPLSDQQIAEQRQVVFQELDRLEAIWLWGR